MHENDKHNMDAPRSIHRRLIVRLLAVWFAVSVVLGGIDLYVEMAQVDRLVIDLAIKESARFTDDSSIRIGSNDPRDLKNLTQALEELIRRRFVIVEIYGIDRISIVEKMSEHIGDLEHTLDRRMHEFPVTGEAEFDRFFLGGRIYVRAIVPMTDASGRAIGFFEGVYELDEARTAAIIRSIAVGLLQLVIAILATILVLYPIITALNRSLQNRAADLLRANVEILKVLGSAIAKRDGDTHAHNYRVTIYAVRLAQVLGLAPGAIRRLIKGAFLHDVGKIAISDQILLKPGKLTDEEFKVMETHVGHGVDIVNSSAWLEDARDVVRCHHEKYGGDGYPEGLRGDDIPKIARIFAVADVFDALTSERPYKRALGLDEALSIIDAGRGNHFDPGIVDGLHSIAADLYAEFARREDEGLEVTLENLLGKYFDFAAA